MPAAPAPRQVQYNPWSEPLYRLFDLDDRPDFMVISGGRGSSKTYEITQALSFHGHARPLRICVAREHLKSIDESAKIELEDRMRNLGLLRPDCYDAKARSIDHANGTHVFFIGMSKVSEEDIKGLAMVDLLWIEEAHQMSHKSWELIRPTIRKDGSVIILSFNPRYRNDAVWQFSQRMRGSSRVIFIHVTFRDNAFFTARNHRERLDDKRLYPDRYPHVWEGQPDDYSAARKVIPYAMLQQCVDAWDRRPPLGAFRTAGLDVADTGADRNFLAIRGGPSLFHTDRWHGSLSFTPSDTARRAADIAKEHGVDLFNYDAGGVGSAIRGPMIEHDVPFAVEGCHFGGGVQGPKRHFTLGMKPKTNAEYFANWASQAGWAVRMRADMTQRLVAGEDVDPEECLFVRPDMADLPDILAEISQPEYDTRTGKLKINKRPHGPGEPEPPSPDGYDATILAFSDDARFGLQSLAYTRAG